MKSVPGRVNASLQVELSVPSEAMDSSIRFLAMLVGPFYPFLALFKAVR
jgi:hypothetical protein